MAKTEMNIHLIDDDEKLHQLLQTYLNRFGVHLTASATPSAGLAFLERYSADLVILDLMLPEMDGFEVCKQLRHRYPMLPIVMLTAKGDDSDKIVGLELGADDYLSKPFNPRELLARIKTILRRVGQAVSVPEETYQIYAPTWDILIDLRSRQVMVQQQSVSFTATEFDLLKFLMQNVGIVQSRDNLMDKVRGLEFEAFDRAIDVHISKIRQKLHDNSKSPQIVKTVWGIGYIFSRL